MTPLETHGAYTAPPSKVAVTKLRGDNPKSLPLDFSLSKLKFECRDWDSVPDLSNPAYEHRDGMGLRIVFVLRVESSTRASHRICCLGQRIGTDLHEPRISCTLLVVHIIVHPTFV